MNLKMTEVQKAYLLGRNKTFDGKYGTHMYLEFKFNGKIEDFESAFNVIVEKQPMLRAKVKDFETFDIISSYKYSIKKFQADDNDFEKIRLGRRKELSHKLYKKNDFPFYTIESISNKKFEHLILMSIDLLIADGLSLFNLFDGLKKIIKEGSDYTEDKTKELLEINKIYLNEKETKRYLEDKRFWLDKITTLPPAPELLVHESKINSSAFKRKEYTFSKKEFDIFEKIAESSGCSTSTILFTIYCATLQSWSENKEFTINMTSFKRPRKKKYLEVIGDFTSTVLVDTNIDPNENIIINSKNNRKKIFDSFKHSKFEGTEVLRELKKHGKSNIMPFVFTSMLFEFENFDSLGTIEYWISETPQVYLDCQVKLINGRLNVSWDYLEDLFELNQINEMYDIFILYVEQFINNPSDSMNKVNEHLNKLTEKKYKKYNTTHKIKNTTSSLINSFDKTKRKYSNYIAFKDSVNELSFSLLDRESQKIFEKIKKIKKEKGLNKIRIGISGKKNTDRAIEMLGIIKSGDSFCFISDGLPEKRYKKLIKDNSISILIKDRLVEYIGFYDDTQIQQNELYVVFTSGTTGTPKGISISEVAVLNTIDDIIERTNFSNKEFVFNISELSFDLSIFDLLVPLITGSSTYLCDDVSRLFECKDIVSKATFWNSTPGLLQSLMGVLDNHNTSIRNILISGDFIPKTLCKEIPNVFFNSKLNVWGLGGATEASIWSIYYPLNNFVGERVPYGYPLSNQQIYVLDTNDNLVNSNVVGELIISGKGLFNGYTNNSNENKKVFYKHEKLGQIYRTGDKGFLSDDGTINILGRIKTDLKLNGYRIDLKEIENALNEISGIIDSKVIVQTNKNQKKYLMAFYKGNKEFLSSDIRKALHNKLPKYMIPTIFVFLAEFPLTSNGKINIKELVNINKDKYSDLKLSESENDLLSVWIKVLGESSITYDVSKFSTFFEIGGDSIKLPELLNSINKTFSVDISIEELLNNFTLSDQVRLIQRSTKKEFNTITSNDSMIRIKKGTTNRNIVLIHAGSGEIGIYNSLSKNISEIYNVYAIKFDKTQRGLIPEKFNFSMLAKEYNKYLFNLKSIDYLGGWCIGGTIGYEICKINPNVNSLLLINSLPPVEQVEEFNFSIENEKLFLEKSFEKINLNTFSNLNDLWLEVIGLLEKNPEMMKNLISIVPKQLSRLIPFFGNNSAPELIYYINLFRSFEATRKSYQDHDFINQDIIYIGAKNEEIPNYQLWKKRSRGNWREFHLYGDHTTIFDNPNVENMANYINELSVSE